MRKLIPRFASVVLMFCFVVIARLDAATDDAPWRVGFARAVITPRQPVPLAGYAARKVVFRKVEDNLHVKALALEDEKGKRAVLITCDLLGMSKAVAETIARKIGDASGLKRHEILLNFSHTHTGPSVALSMGPSARYPQAEVDAIVSYSHWLVDTVVETAVGALAQKKPARLNHAMSLIHFPVNRREYTSAGVILGFNPRGPTDRSVPVLRITSPDGALLGVVFGAACHNTCLTQRDNDVSGDYAGYAQAILEQNFKGAQAMFMQGCGGDTSPYPTGTLAVAQAHGKNLADVVTRVLRRKQLHNVNGPLSTHLRWLDLPLTPPPTAEEIEAMSKEKAAWRRQAAARLRELNQRGDAGPDHYPAPFALWQFGSDLTLVGLSGEPVADYVMLIEKALGPLNLWVAGYTNDHFGYLPTRRILSEGGYEALRGLGHGRRFAPKVEETVVRGVTELAAEAGRVAKGAATQPGR